MSDDWDEGGFPTRLPERGLLGAARLADRIAPGCRPVALVSGFWRSGTTWLQELLASSFACKTIFEPLSPLNPAWDRQLSARGVPAGDLREARIPGPAAGDLAMWAYLDTMFSGRASSDVSLLSRRTVRESFRRGVIVKDVRLQANLALVHARYGVPVIHVRRHPCGVVASLQAVHWHWSFERVRLDDVLAPLEGALLDIGLDVRGLPRAFDADAVARIATLWAATERLAAAALDGAAWGLMVGYEDAVGSTDDMLLRCAALLGRAPRRLDIRERNSATTVTSSRGTSVEGRPQAWRGRLGERDVGRVLGIVGEVLGRRAF